MTERIPFTGRMDWATAAQLIGAVVVAQSKVIEENEDFTTEEKDKCITEMRMAFETMIRGV